MELRYVRGLPESPVGAGGTLVLLLALLLLLLLPMLAQLRSPPPFEHSVAKFSQAKGAVSQSSCRMMRLPKPRGGLTAIPLVAVSSSWPSFSWLGVAMPLSFQTYFMIIDKQFGQTFELGAPELFQVATGQAVARVGGGAKGSGQGQFASMLVNVNVQVTIARIVCRNADGC